MIDFICVLLGRISLACAGSMLLPFIYTHMYEDDRFTAEFSYSILFALIVMILLFIRGKDPAEKLSVSGGAAFMFLSWLLLALLGTLPYVLTGVLSIPDALMECISGFTTTGLTSLPYTAPSSIILWRSVTQWVGGLNILITLAAIIPAVTKGFGIFYSIPVNLRNISMTMQQISNTTFRVSLMYTISTLFCLSFLSLSGLSWFEVVNFVMVTISTGGCYVSDPSTEYNVWVFVVITFSLIASGFNVLIYMQAKTLHQFKKNIYYSLKSIELRIFLVLVLICSLIITSDIYIVDDISGTPSLLECFGTAMFHVASFASTTGVMVERISSWSELDKLLLVLLSIVGGCIGSMAGGFKMMRVIILLKTSWAEMTRTLHPRMVVNIKVEHDSVPVEVISRILSFFFLYVVIIMFSMMVISLSGCTMQQSMYIAIGCLTSTGQTALFHMFPSQVYELPHFVKIFCCFLMILGKVEILSFLVLIQGCIQKLNKEQW